MIHRCIASMLKDSVFAASEANTVVAAVRVKMHKQLARVLGDCRFPDHCLSLKLRFEMLLLLLVLVCLRSQFITDTGESQDVALQS